MRKFLKPVTLLPIFMGIAIGTLLFVFGSIGDAPGLCLIGLVTAFILIMWGVHNTGVIKKGFLAPIFLLCFGMGGILLSLVLLLDGEFEESPGIALIGVALGIALIVAGTFKAKKANVR